MKKKKLYRITSAVLAALLAFNSSGIYTLAENNDIYS